VFTASFDLVAVDASGATHFESGHEAFHSHAGGRLKRVPLILPAKWDAVRHERA
jgi:hypothetical protein